MKFKVKAPTGALVVDFKFGTARDFQLLSKWRSPGSQRKNPLVKDALEYRSLAGKRWRSYSSSRRTVTSLNALRRAIRKDPTCEIVFFLTAVAKWHSPSPILGFCFCRRTWCNHFILDFAASHPNAIRAAGGEIKGVGAGMLYSLVSVADQLGVGLVWGEATLNSVGFYRYVLEVPHLTDHFFIEGPLFKQCLREYERIAIA